MPFSGSHVAEQFARRHPGHEGLLSVIEDALIERRPSTCGSRITVIGDRLLARRRPWATRRAAKIRPNGIPAVKPL